MIMNNQHNFSTNDAGCDNNEFLYFALHYEEVDGIGRKPRLLRNVTLIRSLLI